MPVRTPINAPDALQPAGGYVQAMHVAGAERLLFVSGQIPVAPDGTVPADFAGQAALVWRNLDAQLHAAGMTKDDLVKVTIFLASRDHIADYRAARVAYLEGREVALTTIITGIFDTDWLLEIEAVAAR